MSSANFWQQVLEFRKKVVESVGLCRDIKTNKCTSTSTSHRRLNRLRSALEFGNVHIAASYHDQKQIFGSQLDIGDELVGSQMGTYMDRIQSTILSRLREIAQKPSCPYRLHRRSRSHKRRELGHPGFGTLLGEWKSILEDFDHSITALCRRILFAKSVSAPNHTSTRSRSDSNLPFPHDYLCLVEHMRNSWVETIANGKLEYINVYSNIRISERPAHGYIKSCQVCPKSFERRSSTLDSDYSAERTLY